MIKALAAAVLAFVFMYAFANHGILRMVGYLHVRRTRLLTDDLWDRAKPWALLLVDLIVAVCVYILVAP